MNLQPKLVNGDREILNDIFNLRVEAWENSENNQFINKELFPEGFSDELDDSGIHWYIEDNTRVIGAIRMNIINSIDDFGYGKLFSKFALPAGPYAYFSRIVIHPDYRDKNLGLALAKATMDAFSKSPVKHGLTLYTPCGFAERFGFQLLGDTEIGRMDVVVKLGAYIISKN